MIPLVHFFLPLSVRLISASSARLPPSPLLSARMMIVTYFSVTMIIIDQKIRLSTPIDVQLVGNQRVMAGEGLAEGVDRRRADVAEDDADRADDELVQRALGVAVRAVLRGFGYGAASRGDVHVLRFRPDRLRTRIPCAASDDPRSRTRAP